MSENWVCIYSSTAQHHIEIVSAVLNDFEIENVVMNKQDSSYLFGALELYVQPKDVIKAKQIIQENKL